MAAPVTSAASSALACGRMKPRRPLLPGDLRRWVAAIPCSPSCPQSGPMSGPIPGPISGPISGPESRTMANDIASAPRIGRNSPDSDSSPANSYRSTLSAGIWREAARMPSAIGKSKRPDSLGRSAGARLTVMRWAGNSKPPFWMAARTRSLASFTSVSAKPTIVNAGKPLARCTSTLTCCASMPARARLLSTARLMCFPCVVTGCAECSGLARLGIDLRQMQCYVAQ